MQNADDASWLVASKWRNFHPILRSANPLLVHNKFKAPGYEIQAKARLSTDTRFNWQKSEVLQFPLHHRNLPTREAANPPGNGHKALERDRPLASEF